MEVDIEYLQGLFQNFQYFLSPFVSAKTSLQLYNKIKGLQKLIFFHPLMDVIYYLYNLTKEFEKRYNKRPIKWNI